MTSKLTRGQLHERARENVKALKMASRQHAFESAREEILADLQLAEIALAAMDSEPHTDDELSNLLWYSQEATCHSDPNYYCEFQRLATPGLIAGIIRELQERRKAERDSEPVAWRRFQETPTDGGYWILYDYKPNCSGVEPLYRHAQPAPEKYNIGDATMRHIFTPTGMTNVSDMQAVFDRVEAVLVGMNQQAPVVPDGYVMVPACLLSELRDWAHPEIEDYCDMLAGRRDHEFPALRKIIADADALLAAADCSIPMISDRWIPVSDQMPEIGDIVLTSMGGVVNVGETECSAANCRFFTSVISGRELPATHWMPLPAGPQEGK